MVRRHLAHRLLPAPLALALGVAWLWPAAAAPVLALGLVAAAGVALLPLHGRELQRVINGAPPGAGGGGLLGVLARRWGRLHRYHATLALLVYLWLAGLTLFFDHGEAITAVFGGALALWGILYSQRRGAHRRRAPR